MQVLAYRSKNIDEVVQKSSKNKDTNKNIFYEKPEFRNQLQDSVQTLEKMLRSNEDMGKVFAALEKDVEKMKKLDELNSKFSQIEDVVVSLDNLVKVNDFEDVLSQMSNVSYRLSGGRIDEVAAKVT